MTASTQINPGKRPAATGGRAAVSSDNIIVTEAMTRILELGGKAVDAAIAGCMVQAVVEPYMTNHTGTVTMLHWSAADAKAYQLDSTGTFPSGLAPFKPVPFLGLGSGYGASPPSACIPGFMPGLKAMHERFATLPWKTLCEDAVRWAESGHQVGSFEYTAHQWGLEFTTYTASGRDFYQPGGRLPNVGETFRSAAMAETIRRVAEEGPDHMITGAWADRFVALGNAMGWKIDKSHMTETPPRWIEPIRAKVAGYEVLGLAPPQRQGVHTAFVLGVLEAMDIGRWGPRDPKRLLLMSHLLRWAEKDLGYINDPERLAVPTRTFLDPAYHAHVARILLRSLPRVDLSEHVRLTSPQMVLRGLAPLVNPGLPRASEAEVRQAQPPGSCELSVVDADGDWVQMMNTLQSGGIPGQVLDGIPMIGSHAFFGSLGSALDVRLTPGARMRSIMANTMVLKDGRPVLSLGTPGRPGYTVAQVLANVIFHGMSPVEAVDEPRMLPLTEDGVVIMEDRLSQESIDGLSALGVPVRVVPAWDWQMGSMQVCWREADGAFGAYADPRRCGVAAALPRAS